MAVFTGNSTQSFQELGRETLTASKAISLDISPRNMANYTQRLGLLVVSQYIPNLNWRPVQVYKVFATGLLVRPPYPLFPLEYVFWMDWYIPNRAWVLNTF